MNPAVLSLLDFSASDAVVVVTGELRLDWFVKPALDMDIDVKPAIDVDWKVTPALTCEVSG